MSSEAWTTALDRIEADLAGTEEALAGGDGWPEQPGPPTPPVAFPDGRMPAELGSRAEALLGRTRNLQARAAEEIDGIRDALRALAGRRAPARTQTGRIVDFGA